MGVDFRVLGPVEVVVDGQRRRLGGPQARAVLALLALRANQTVPTEALVHSLWGDRIPASAVSVVRTYVSRLRRALPPTAGARLASRPPGYVLETEAEHVDAHRFSRLVREARWAAESGRPEVASATLDQALGLWRGSAMADLTDLEGLRPLAIRLEEQRLSAVEDRMEAELALGHHAAVIGELEALTQEHLFRERLWGQLIVALYRSGRQADALAAYQTVRAALIEHVGVDPGPELRALEQQVLHQADELGWVGPRDHRAAPPGPPPIAAPPSEQAGAGSGAIRRLPLQAGISGAPDDRPVVGRVEERDLLGGHLGAARAGRFRTVFVAGPPGIGKSALTRWSAREAHAAGAIVVAGWADEGAGVPLQPLREAIDHWAARADAGWLDQLAEADAGHLAPLVPALAERRDGRVPPPVPGVDRQRVFEAIARWIEALAASQPALVLLEDLHWADPLTLLAVRHLVRHPPAAGALLLATHRDSDIDIDGHHPLRDVLAGTHGNDLVARIDLAGLLDDDVADLVQAHAGLELDESGRAFAADLNRWTGGNPLFIHETLRHLDRRRAPSPTTPIGAPREMTPTGAGPEALTVDALGAPPGVTELVERRLQRLPEATRAALQTAAVLGLGFELPVLSSILGTPELAVIEALEPALVAGLVVRDPTAGPNRDRFAFTHALMREAVLDTVPLSHRVRTHWRAGEALLAAPTGDPELDLGEIARHLAAGVRAGDRRTAAAANVRAGRYALATLAFEEAVARFSTAVDLLGAGEGGDPDLACTAWQGLGEASGALGDTARQRRGFLQAASIARRRRRPDDLARAAVGLVTHGLAAGGDVLTDASTASLVDDALDGPAGTYTAEQCGLLAVKAVLAVSRDRRPEALALAGAADDTARRLRDPSAEASALMARCWTLLGAPRPSELRTTAERALSLGGTPAARLLVWHLVTPVLLVPALQLGDDRALRAVQDRLATETEARASRHVTACVRACDAALALGQGRFDEAAQMAGDLRRANDWVLWRNASEFQMGLILVERGEQAAVTDRLLRRLAEEPAAPASVVLRALLASLRAGAGDRTAALHHVATLRRQRPLDQLGWNAPFALRHLAEVAARLGDARLAADLLPILTPYGGQMLVTFTGVTVEGAADRALGQALLPLGRFDDAIRRLTAARALEQSLGATALATRTAYWHARALLARGAPGDADRAGRLRREASHDARRLGMAQLARDIDALVADA